MKITFCVTCYDGDVHLLEDRLLSIYSEQTVQPDEVLVITSGVGSGSIVWDASKPNLTIKTFEQRKKKLDFKSCEKRYMGSNTSNTN